MRWRNLLQTKSAGWTLLVRLMVGLVVFFPEGLQKLVLPEILGAGRFAHIGIPYPELLGPSVGIVETVSMAKSWSPLVANESPHSRGVS